MTEWKLIDTAPKIGSGSPLMLIFSKKSGLSVGRWREGWGWSTVPGDYSRKPTHWAPMPNLPTGP